MHVSQSKSVQSALHPLVIYNERYPEYEKYTLKVFLDIEGAFNNLNLDLTNTTIYCRMLRLEIIRSRIGTTSLRNSINRNTPQGEVHYLLLWNIALNSLLVRLYSLDFRTIAYADDVAIAISTGSLPGWKWP